MSKLETSISSTKIHFKLTAKLFGHLEAAAVSKTKALCLLFMALQLIPILLPACLPLTDPSATAVQTASGLRKGSAQERGVISLNQK